MRPIRCVFFGDLYPNEECYDAETASGLRVLLKVRKNVAGGPVTDYLENRNYIGWFRGGDRDRVCAIIISNADAYVLSHSPSNERS
jgi:alpha-amylase